MSTDGLTPADIQAAVDAALAAQAARDADHKKKTRSYLRAIVIAIVLVVFGLSSIEMEDRRREVESKVEKQVDDICRSYNTSC